MTTGTNPKPPSAWRRWALAELDLQPGMSNDEARRILFQRLSDVDFVPPGGWDGALRVAGIAPCDGALDSPVFMPARRAAEESLRSEVEAFALKFFALTPDIRTAQYQELLKQCAGAPAVAARLEGLRPALELPRELPNGQPDEVADLLDQACRLFVLPRQERASRRLAFVKQCRLNLVQWQRPAKIVQTKFARYAALEPALFRELCISGNREKVRGRLARRRKRRLAKHRVYEWLLGAQRERLLLFVVLLCALIGGPAGYFLEKSKSRYKHPVFQSPSQSAQIKKASDEMDKFVNDSIRDGKPIPEVIRRLYGLPPQQKPLPKSPTPPPGRPNQHSEQNRERMRDLMRRLDQLPRPDEAP
jgi:hypothetical protein